MEINDTVYVCWHEVGHALACLELGGDVEFIEMIEDESSIGKARARCSPTNLTRKHVACGGFAAEYILYKGGHLLGVNEKQFIDIAFNNAILDKKSFFGGDYIKDDGYWPKEMDQEFMEFAIYKVAPILQKNIQIMQSLVDELIKNQKIEREDICQIMKK